MYGSHLNFSTNYDYYRKIKEDEAKYGNEIYSLEVSPSFYLVKKKSMRDLISPLGFVANYSYKNSPIGVVKYGELQGGQIALYVPGLFKHHGIRLLTGIQKTRKDNLTYSNVISTTRGYGKITNSEMRTFSVDYKLPLFYPDWNIGKVIYLKRFHLGIFGDYTQAKNEGKWHEYKTTGLELFADLHLFQWVVPFQIGFRFQYLPDTQKFKFNMLNEAKYNDL